MIGPTAHAFWNHWRDEHSQWRIMDVPAGFIATDRGRYLEPSSEAVVDPMAQKFTAEICSTRALAHTYIALRCTQYALEKLGVA